METSHRIYALTTLVCLTITLITAGCSRFSTQSDTNQRWSTYDSLLRVDPERADTLLSDELTRYPQPPADSFDYCTLLHRCAVAANNDSRWSRSDSLTDIVWAYTKRHEADCNPGLPRLSYLNDVTTALCAIYSGRLPRAIEYLEAARATAYRHSMTERYYDVAINISDVYIQAGRLPEAAENLRHGLYLCDSLNLPATSKIPFFNALSSLYFQLGDYTSAMRYSDEAHPYVAEAMPLDRFSFWCDRGNVYYMLSDFESALECFDSCYAIGCRGEVSDYNAYIARLNRSDVQVHLSCYDNLEPRLDSCEAYFEANDLTACSYYLTTLRARILLERDDDADGAIALLKQSPDLDVSDYLCYLRQTLLRECYARIGRMDSIVGIDRAILAYKDSLLDNLAAMRVADVELRYKENIRESQLLARQQSLELRIFIAVLLVLVLALIFVASIFHYRNQRRLRDLEREHLMHDILQEKVRGLRQRLSPHYLMNLAHILDSSNSTSDEAAIAMTLRHSLEISNRIAVSLSDEISFVKDYLHFLSQSSSIDIEWEIAPDVHLEQVRVLGMTLQLPLENAVKHAYPGTATWPEKKVRIMISRTRRNAHSGTEIIIEDYGVGLPATGLSCSNGISIMRRTIAYLNTHNSVAIEHNLTDKSSIGEGHGIKVEFFFPDDYDYLE